jgi:flagellar P-ring protein precursor FlgI
MREENAGIEGRVWRAAFVVAVVLSSLFPLPSSLSAQEMIRVRDLTMEDRGVPVRLLGYGLVVGLDGTGDKASGGKDGSMTVNTVLNLLKRFDIEVPAQSLKSKNVAAVAVTAEISPYLRPGGRFEVHVSSLGDARSLRGGILWMTPLVYEAGGEPVATVQGPILMAERGGKSTGQIENSGRMPSGGLLEVDLPRPQFNESDKLILKEPDITMASRVATAINKELGEGMAKVEDPGSIALNLKDAKEDRATVWAHIRDLRVQPARAARLIIDGRSGAIVSGGDLTVGEATVTQGALTLSVGAVDTTAATAGQVRVPSGTPVMRIAAALHAVQTPAAQIAAIFESLHAVGAIAAEVVIR